jgi:hypothetical protein
MLRRELPKLIWVLLGAAVVLAATFIKVDVDGVAQPIKLAFPWTFPLGAALTLALGLALGRVPNEPAIPEPSPEPTTMRPLREARA